VDGFDDPGDADFAFDDGGGNRRAGSGGVHWRGGWPGTCRENEDEYRLGRERLHVFGLGN
jgi:hypothetical protein